MATIKDVARAAGVSPSTVSRVVRNSGYVSEEARAAVLAAVERLDYHPNAVARSMTQQRTHTIGVVISDIANPFFPSVVRGMDDVAQSNGYKLIVCNSDEDPAKERDFVRVLLSRQVDGLIVASTGGALHELAAAMNDGVPVVLLDRFLRLPGADAVGIDNIDAAHRAVRHLLELGHRRIGIILGPNHVQTSKARLAGYLKALRAYGVPPDPALQRTGDFKEAGGYNHTQALLALEPRPTALFTTNNLTTTGALMALREAGVTIPDQMAIVGFDDMPWARIVRPALTVVEQPTYLLGTTAAQLLFARLNGRETSPVGRIVQLEANLVVRESCGARQHRSIDQQGHASSAARAR
ncbi:LacI family DNA-binding transcriptional regulator [Limnochorda pilosa]|uniref:LacI family transcriptional regulator n=1 Tax=Limnochorda pilosa TaxID=1555112 RepID=A0A0K2SL83_LIMPI|nr:LacI family DNA-binding transcriptional regulator [Limnochorda pilosa]BAS27881.1 LacI family transcriptional regulator [Limnochorda pilosa]